VAGVGGGGGVTVAHRASEASVADGAGETAVADTLKFSIPAGTGHPDFKLDIGIARRPDDASDAAEGRQIRNGLALRRRESARGNGARFRDGGAGEREFGQRLTIRRGGLHWNAGQEGEQGSHGNTGQLAKGHKVPLIMPLT